MEIAKSNHEINYDTIIMLDIPYTYSVDSKIANLVAEMILELLHCWFCWLLKVWSPWTFCFCLSCSQFSLHEILKYAPFFFPNVFQQAGRALITEYECETTWLLWHYNTVLSLEIISMHTNTNLLYEIPLLKTVIVCNRIKYYNYYLFINIGIQHIIILNIDNCSQCNTQWDCVTLLQPTEF